MHDIERLANIMSECMRVQLSLALYFSKVLCRHSGLETHCTATFGEVNAMCLLPFCSSSPGLSRRFRQKLLIFQLVGLVPAVFQCFSGCVTWIGLQFGSDTLMCKSTSVRMP